MQRWVIFAAIGLLFAAAIAMSGAGYVVVLKNGEKIRCKEPMKIQGSQAILTLATGTLASYPLQYVDVVETERYNKQGLGDAVMIDELTVREDILPTPTPKRPLGEMASIDAGTDPALLGSTTEPTPSPTPGIKLRDMAYRDPRVTQAFTRIFDERDLYIYRTSTGTKPEFFFVQTVTDSQPEVFKALRIVAEAFAVIHKLDATMAPDSVELEMVETSGKPAGTFRLTAELAEQLATGEATIEQFYVENVIF
jgi:hypothetical protein